MSRGWRRGKSVVGVMDRADMWRRKGRMVVGGYEVSRGGKGRKMRVSGYRVCRMEKGEEGRV